MSKAQELQTQAVKLLTQGIGGIEETVEIREPLIAAIEAKTGKLPSLVKCTTYELIKLHRALCC